MMPPSEKSQQQSFIVLPNAGQRRNRRLRTLLVLITVSAFTTIFTQLKLTFPSYYTRTTAVEWQDNIWPIRPQEPWDISTDFRYPRKLEYEVTEGTWLRLDVHPVTGDVVFDMIGDLYCIPGAQTNDNGNSSPVEAYPILRGIPHDSDPHFSPSGDKLVFRSDAGLGLDNIWITPWRESCENMKLSDVDTFQVEDEKLLLEGVQETFDRRARRLTREGRAAAHQVTNETFRYVTDARFHPSGERVIATKWYTSSRSLGAGEGWEYDLPKNNDTAIEVGSGKRLVERTLPVGWSPVDDYNRVQIGGEQYIWKGNDTLIYAKNVVDPSTFQYSKDTHKGIYSIFSKNLTTGRTSTIVDRFPGGASRPELSRDQRTLAFVRRFRDYGALVLKDLSTGTTKHIWHGLTYDLSNIAAPMGTYPSFAFTPDDSAIIIWAAGQIYRVSLKTNGRGEREAAGEPTPIRFKAEIKKRIAETRLRAKGEFDLVGIETAETQRVRAFEGLQVDESGDRVVFQAAGATIVYSVSSRRAVKVPVLKDDEGVTPYYSPSFLPNDNTKLIHARWDDTNFTTFEIADLDKGKVVEVTRLPLGRYISPVVSSSEGSHQKLAFIKLGGDSLTGSTIATANPGLYTAALDSKTGNVKDLEYITASIDGSAKLEFVNGSAQELLVRNGREAYVIDLAGPRDKTSGAPPQYTIASGRMSSDIDVHLVKPSNGWSSHLPFFGTQSSNYTTSSIAFVDFKHIYVAPGVGEAVWSKPGNATAGLTRLSVDGGHDIAFSGDGKTLFWFLGPFLHHLKLSKLDKCKSEIAQDKSTFGIDCVRKLLEYEEVIVKHSTDIARIKKSASSSSLVIVNATLLTMEHGDAEKDLVQNGVLVVKDGLINSIQSLDDFVIPQDATVVDAEGGYVVPGFIDMHAHWGGFYESLPAKSWEMETFLAYGVTTLHNPSTDDVKAYVERSRVERGQMVGPRIFHTGGVIYGAADEGLHQDIANFDEARSALVRIKAEGGPVTTSYKNYNLPSRASRQRLLLAAQNLSMLCVPEGGMNYDWNIAYIVDGMTTIEHNIPVSPLYDDVLKLYAWSGTSASPTHIVNYGGAMGEQYLWANHDIPNDPKLRQFVPHGDLEAQTESTARPITSYSLFNSSASVAQMVNMGLRTHIGAHGEPPLGLMYHTEMLFTSRGGLTNYQVLQAATSSAATTLGLTESLGSLAPGKLADFVVYKPGSDLLGGDIKVTRDIRLVARGGRLWNADDMVELWPSKGKKQRMPPFNPD